jgi:hypothetical protein
MKIQKMQFYPPKMDKAKKLMVPLESALPALSNEWSCLPVSTILNFLDNFCVPMTSRGRNLTQFSPSDWGDNSDFSSDDSYGI